MGTPLYESDGSFDDSGSSSPEERSKATSAHRSVPMAQRRTSQSEKRKSVDLEGLYRQAAHEFNEVDKICQARTMFAPTEDLERALALLYKWSEDVERLYGLEAANYLKRKSVANPAIVDRRKAELRRVLELRKLSGRREGNDAASSSTTTIAPDTDSALRPMSPSVVASATNTRISLSVPDSQSELFCNQCRRGPLSCMHSHRRVQKFFERGLEHATSEELDIVKRTLCNFISRGGNPFGIEPVHKYSKPKLQADEEHWLSQLEEFFNFQPYRRRASSPIDPSETMESRIPKKSRFYCQKCQKLRPDSCGHKRQKMKELSVIADKILSARDNNNNRSRIAQQQALYDTPNAGDFDIARRFLDDWSKRDEADYGLEHIQKERERGTGLLAEEAEWTRQFEQVIRLRKPSDSAWENTNGLGVSRRMSTSKDKDTSKFAADAIAENSGQNSVHQDIEMVDADFHPSNKRRHTDDLYAQPTKARKLTDQDRLFHGEDHGAPNALPNLQPLHRDSGIGLEEEDRTHSMKVSILRSRLSEELSIVPKAKLVSILENLCDRNEMMVEYFAKELLDERLQQTALGNAVTQLLSASTAEQNSSRKPTRKSYPAASTENARHKSSRLKGRMSFPSLDVPEEEEIANLGHAETSGPVSGSHKCLRCSSICDLDGVRSTTECHYHDGDLVWKSSTVQGPEYYSKVVEPTWLIKKNPRLGMWTCCNRDADGTACRQSLHKFEAQDEEVELSGSHLATLARSSSAASFVDQQPVRARTRSGEDVGEEHESDELSEPDDIQSPSDGDDDTGIFDTPGKVISKKRPGRQQAEVADYHLLPDYSPLLSSLPRNMKLDCPDISVHLLDLSDDPDRLMLHEAELQLASALRLNCRTYLYFKRQIFHAALESLQDGNLLKISETRKIIKGSNAKATGLFRAFNNAGWFQKSNFDRWIVKPNQGPESGGPEWRDYPRNAEGLPDPPMHHYPKSRLGSVPERSRTARAQETNSAEEPAQKVSTPYSATYDSFTPVNRPNGATVESPTVEPTTTNPETGKPSKYVRLRVSYPNFDTIIKAENPPSVPSYPAADPEPNDPTYTTPKARRQPRPGNSGSKPRVTASYPKTWGEASEKDRRMVEMKRRENRSWPEIFSWWEKTGVNTLKDSNCLAVRYSLIKKKFEHIWIEEERQYALQHPEESNGSTAPASEEPAADVPMIDAPTSDVTTDAQQTNDVPVEETASNGTPNHNETAKEAPTTIVEPVTAATEHASKGPSADKDISSNVQAEKEETDKTNAPGTEGAENGVAQAERPAEEATTPSLAT